MYTLWLQAEKCGVRISFGHQLTSADFDEGTLVFKTEAGETKVKVIACATLLKPFLRNN